MNVSSKDIPAGARPARFWRWWTTELAHLFAVRPPAPRRPKRQVRIVDGEAIVTDAKGRERDRQVLLPEEEEGDIAPGRSLALILPDDAVLVRTREVPRRTEAELDRVMEYEFAAHIPLDRAACYAAHRIVARKGDTLRVIIAAAPRAVVDDARRALSRVGLSPAWVGTGDVPLNLLSDGRRRRSRAGGGVALLLGGLALAALAVAAWYPALQLREYNAALQLRADTAMARANSTLRMRQDLDAIRTRLDALDRFAAPVGLLPRIEAMARGIPQDTSLVSLSFDDGVLTATAQTPDPAELMQTIAALPGLGTPELTSPVNRQQDGRARVALAIPLEAAP